MISKTHFLNVNPFLKLCIPLIFGILSGFQFNINVSIVFYIAIGFLSIFLVLHFFVKNPKHLFLVSLIGYLLLFVLGIWLTERQEIHNQKTNFVHSLDKKTKGDFLYGNIVESPEEKDKTIKVLLHIDYILNNNIKQESCGKLLAYIQKDSTSNVLKKGDKLLFLSNIQMIPKPLNPGEFDYSKFMANKNILYQQYLPKSTYSIIHNQKVDVLEQFKFYYLALLEKYVINKKALSLAKGLIIGYRSEIDQDIYAAFAHTGIVHILSVSGLHLGIVMTILLWFFSFFPYSNTYWKWFKTILIITLIWAFAIVTGFSTAVQRAALMVTIYLIGKAIDKKTSNYNILFASLFIMLIFNPMVLKDLGLQLSYLALFGLSIFYKKYEELIYFKNKILSKIWEWSATSFAAQTTTLPLTLFYFGNFPTYFLIANPPAILLSFLILALGIALMIFGWIPFLGNIIGWCINASCQLLIIIIDGINKLPFAIWELIANDKWNLLLNFLSVIAIAFFLISQKKLRWMSITIIFIFSSIGIGTFQKIKLIQHPKSIIYAIPKHTIIGSVDGNSLTFYADTLMSSSNKLYNFKLKNSLKQFGAKYAIFDSINKPFYMLNHKSILIWNNELNNRKYQQKILIDYVLVTNNTYLNIQNLKENFIFNQVILDGTLSKFKAEKIKLLLLEEGLQFYDVNSEGAFVF